MIPPQLLIVLLWLGSSCGQQYYDGTDCSSATTNPATRYTCAVAGKSCRTFVVYRTNARFSTVAAVSDLFQTDSDALLAVNHNVSTPTEALEFGHEVLVPIACSCSGDRVYRSYFTYTATQSISISEIACAVYEGLVKSAALAAENPVSGDGDVVPAGSTLRIPVKCACSENASEKAEVKYLITYPFIKGDNTAKLGEKFNVGEEQIWKFNRINPFAPTVFPNTTVLVPVKKEPIINFSIPDSDTPTPEFLPTKPVRRKGQKWSQMKKLVVVGSVVGTFLIIALIISCFLYIKALKKFKDERITAMNSSYSTPTPISSTNSCLSPDVLVGIKYSLSNYSVEELKIATNNFSPELKISSSIYKGDEVMIKEMRFESTKQLIDVHSKINHVNIVKLRGVCYGEFEQDSSCSYLVFELPFNGSLRDSLLNSSASLHWNRRTQIAFDIATGLHYLHYSVTPAYTHLNLSSNNIFLNSNWRAKILVSGERESKLGRWIAPENVGSGKGSEKVEIYAFGVLMLELIAGVGGLDERGVRETMTFFGGSGVNEGGCFEQLRKFVDPCLKDDYPIAEALCLAVLAGSCVEDDPKHRPSMEDVLKILARMV